MKHKDNILHRHVCIFLILNIVITIFFLVVVCRHYKIACTQIDMAATGQIGDFLGGIIGTVLTFATVYLLFKTYEQQRQLNQTQTSQWMQVQVESNYFKLIEDFQNIDFKSKAKSRIEQFAEIRNELNKHAKINDLISIKDYFDNRMSRANRKLGETLNLIMNYISKQPETFEANLVLNHLASTTTMDEKEIFYYFICAFPDKIEANHKAKYFKHLEESGMLPQNYKSLGVTMN